MMLPPASPSLLPLIDSEEKESIGWSAPFISGTSGRSGEINAQCPCIRLPGQSTFARIFFCSSVNDFPLSGVAYAQNHLREDES